jgi:PLD-like domain
MRTVLGKLNGELLANLALQAGAFCSQVEAAVAYVGGPEHPLVKTCKEKGLRLVFYGLLDQDGAVSVPFLKELLSWGPSRAEVRLVKGHFHSKVIWWRGFGAYVGSANLTDKAWFNNIEAGIFFEEAELLSTGVGAQLDELFDHLARNSVSVTDEMIAKLEKLAQARRPLDAQAGKLKEAFNELFQNIPDNPGLIVKPAKGVKENQALKRFTSEWMATLQLMRGLIKEFSDLKLRPGWVAPGAHPAVHFDQFLHAYYYDYVRGGIAQDDEDELSGIEKVEAYFKKHRGNPAGALKEAAQWWAALPSEPYGEELFIREIAPGMQERLSKLAVQGMTLPSFTEALRTVNAFRMHARQVKNTEIGLPVDRHESIDDRVRHLCKWLWDQRSPAGRTVRDVLEFVLWGSSPSDMEQRLWLGVWSNDYRIAHFGQSTLGEAVGWARPDDYPPRNNRTNKALRSLGHDVKLFSNT